MNLRGNYKFGFCGQILFILSLQLTKIRIYLSTYLFLIILIQNIHNFCRNCLQIRYPGLYLSHVWWGQTIFADDARADAKNEKDFLNLIGCNIIISQVILFGHSKQDINNKQKMLDLFISCGSWVDLFMYHGLELGINAKESMLD